MSHRKDERNAQIYELMAVHGMTAEAVRDQLDLQMSPRSVQRIAVEHANRIGMHCSNLSQLRRRLRTKSTYIRSTAL
jgi:hypothetical protein